MTVITNLFRSLKKRVRKATQWALMEARRGRTYSTQSAYKITVNFPIRNTLGISICEEGMSSAAMPYDDIHSSTTTSTATVATMDASSIFGTSDGLSSNISITISHNITHTSYPADCYPTSSLSTPPYVIASEPMQMADPADESLQVQVHSFSTPADPNTIEPISTAGSLIDPGSASLERLALEVFDEKPKVTVIPIHKRLQINNSDNHSDNTTTSEDESKNDMISEDEFEDDITLKRLQINNSDNQSDNYTTSEDESENDMISEDESENNMTPDYESATDMISDDQSENNICEDNSDDDMIAEDESDNDMIFENQSDEAMILDPLDVVVDGAFDAARLYAEPPQAEVFIEQTNGSNPNACGSCTCKEAIDEFMKEIIQNVESVAQGTVHFRFCPSVRGDPRRWSA